MSVGERDALENEPSGAAPGVGDPGAAAPGETDPGTDGGASDDARASADGGPGASARDEGGDGAPEPTPTDGDGAPAEPVEELTPEQQEIASLREQLEQARQANEQTTARLRAVSKAYTDLQHEMKAFKERMEQRAKLDSELQAFDQVKVFFDPVMNLRRSLAAAGDEEALRTGLAMIEHQFMEALHKLGLCEVPGEGSRFDPTVHEAIAVRPVSDPAEDGVVLEVHTTGYRVGSRVLQAAQVVIGKHEEAVGEA